MPAAAPAGPCSRVTDLAFAGAPCGPPGGGALTFPVPHRTVRFDGFAAPGLGRGTPAVPGKSFVPWLHRADHQLRGQVLKSPFHYIAAGCQQVAFVVEDLQAAERFFQDSIGVPRFCRFEDIAVEDSVYRGSPGDFHYHLSLGFAGDMQIELIQHLSGESIYKEFLDQHGTGVHHLACLVEDHEQVVRDFTLSGFPPVQSGRIGSDPGGLFAYFDTRPATGIFMETIVLDRAGKAMFAAIKRGDF